MMNVKEPLSSWISAWKTRDEYRINISLRTGPDERTYTAAYKTRDDVYAHLCGIEKGLRERGDTVRIFVDGKEMLYIEDFPDKLRDAFNAGYETLDRLKGDEHA